MTMLATQPEPSALGPDPSAQRSLVTALWCCYWSAYFAGHQKGRDQFGFAHDFTIDLASAARTVANEVSPDLTLDERIRIASSVHRTLGRDRERIAAQHPRLTARLREAYKQVRQERIAKESRRHFRGDRSYRG
jgi:hypothetical protein